MQHPDFWKPISDKSRPEYAQLLHQIVHAVVLSLRWASLFSGFKIPGFLCCRTPSRKFGQMPSIDHLHSRLKHFFYPRDASEHSSESSKSDDFFECFIAVHSLLPRVLLSNHITRRKSLHSYFITFEGACYIRVAGKRKSLKTTCYGVSDSIKSSLYTDNSFPLR